MIDLSFHPVFLLIPSHHHRSFGIVTNKEDIEALGSTQVSFEMFLRWLEKRLNGNLVLNLLSISSFHSPLWFVSSVGVSSPITATIL